MDGTHHAQERIFYLVAEAGELVVAGLTVKAGKLSSSKLSANGWEKIEFSNFSSVPSVFTSVQTYNGGDPVVTRVHSLTSAGFDMTMDEEDVKDDGHITETLGWIAIEEGRGDTNDSRSVEVLSRLTSSDTRSTSAKTWTGGFLL